MRPNWSNFQILLDCIVMNGIFFHIIRPTSHSPVLQVALPFRYFQNDLTSCAKPGILLPDLGSQCLSAFLVFSSEELGLLRFNCMAVI